MPVSAIYRPRPSISASLLALTLCAAPASAQSEAGRICEVSPILRCLDKARLQGDTLFMPLDASAIRSDGFRICDSSFNYTRSPDIVLIMDNTGSMDSVTEVDGIPRYCEFPQLEKDDPGCISGDPGRLRGPALQAFLDSALAKGGKGMNVGIVTFSEDADATSDKLLPLTAGSIDSIKASIVMDAHLATNYHAAFTEARRLLQSSRKDIKDQFIIFVSDGRPNLPPKDPYAYKAYWDSLPTVHSIFLGDNEANFKDMQEISDRTKGSFFQVRDVRALAGYLTNNLAKQLFSRATPESTVVRNLTTSAKFEVDASNHVAVPDSGAFTLKMAGPLELAKGANDILIRTEYNGGDGSFQELRFSIVRAPARPDGVGLEKSCRALPQLAVFNSKGEEVSLAKPFTSADSAVDYRLTTNAAVDSFEVQIRTRAEASARRDSEAVLNTAAGRKDSTWTGSEPFEHQQPGKLAGDGKVQAEHGDVLVISYHHPFIREDSATVRVRVKYGPDFDVSSYRDLDGDGRIETVRIGLLDALPALPDKLLFRIVDETGASAERTAASGEIKFAAAAGGGEDRKALVVTLSNPFPYGMTSVANADSSGRTFRQIDIPLADAWFRVDDSVPPVIVSAEVSADKATGQPRVVVTYSEPVTLADPALEPLVFKRDTLEFSSKDLPIQKAEKIDERRWAFLIAPGTTYKPVGGDSVAINDNGETRDGNGRSPSTRTYAPLKGPSPKQELSDFFVTFSNGSRSKASRGSATPASDAVFVPVDSKGYPVPGERGEGKCPDCAGQDNGLFAGSVINVVTKQPVRYEFTIFTNLGQPVVHGTGAITEEDMRLLEKTEDGSKDPNQARYVQRIVWTGRTDDGNVAATGAYVLRAVFRYDRNIKTGARPATESRITRFGFLRDCCKSYNDKWYY